MAKTDDQMLVEIARAEQARMRAALAKLQPGGAMRVEREQFLMLANLIDRLAARTACSGDGCFNEPIDGIRWWVPLPEFERARAALDDARIDQSETATELVSARGLY
jgi:hypothetical protein